MPCCLSIPAVTAMSGGNTAMSGGKSCNSEDRTGTCNERLSWRICHSSNFSFRGFSGCEKGMLPVTEIGSVWPHKNGNGFDVVLRENISVSGRIVCTEPKEAKE